MPKLVDHVERRREIAEAVCRLIDSGGIEKVTYRNVAREADTSVGVISHFFADKDALFAHTLDQVSTRGVERARELDVASFDDVVEVVMRALPVDERSQRDARVWVALWGRTIDRPEFAASMIEVDAMWRRTFEDAVAAGIACGALRPQLAEPDRIDRLVIFVDGLNFRAVLDPDSWTTERIRSQVVSVLAATMVEASSER